MVKRKRGRDAETGQFIPVAEADRRKKEAIVETVNPKPAKPRPSKPKKPRKLK
jgi:hypothetical protein